MTEQPDDPDAAQASALAEELRHVFRKMKRRLREQTDLGDFSWSQLSVLATLDREGPATVTVLARVEGMRPQSMGANVAVLEAAGLVQGAPDPADGRQVLLSLTPAGLDWLRAGRAARQDWLIRAIRARLDLRERESLAAAAPLLQRLFDP
ncbi:MarR family winged helix-turn-helix transcriptional regulator [Labrys wisconsinensis]|uniref:DNA-binding MarR family transcriptional regulator n=1 Tax=Labrys wisconsinensis TaxID=425677 RepID=A0ABU0JGD9_9HYPH|nr:MarR family transcriptional regulator [Labrys wisconsinensis]MDQ0473365.1 DNA-binding MarR family transcriptional regulator [Labrys wisconsinensis]